MSIYLPGLKPFLSPIILYALFIANHGDKMGVNEPDSFSLSNVSMGSETPPSYCSKGLPSYRPTSPPSDVLYQPSADPGNPPRYSSRRPSAVLSNVSVEEQPTTQSEELRSGKRRSVVSGGWRVFWIIFLTFAVLLGIDAAVLVYSLTPHDKGRSGRNPSRYD